MKKTRFTKTLIASTLSLAVGTAVAAPYEIIDLGKVEGGSNSFAYGLNNSGEVVGYGDGPLTTDSEGKEVREFSSHALKFDTAAITDFGALDNGNTSLALAINDSGIVIGRANQTRTETNTAGNEISITENFAVSFQGNIPEKLANLTNFSNSQALNINNQNIIVGFGSIDLDPDDDIGNIQRGFVYNFNSQSLISIVDALTDSKDRQSFPLSINDSGVVVGWAEKKVGDQIHALAFSLDTNGTQGLVELPTLNTSVTMARDINNSGLIVGSARHGSGTTRTVSFVYNPSSDNALTRLPFFANNYDNSVANAINDNGQIVGQALVSEPTTGINTGYLFENNELKDLNKLISCNSGWRIDNATNINNNGEIIGYGLKAETIEGKVVNEIRAFKLVPTGGAIEVCQDDTDDSESPSGGSWSLSGLLLLAVIYFRRKFLV